MGKSTRQYKVLMVDDEFMILKGLEKMIDWHGLGLKLVATASHGEEALEKLTQHHIDIIISDINMPRLSGIEFIEEMNRQQRRIEFLFISGYEKFEYIKSGITLGAVDYLLKPIDKHELHQALLKVIERLNQRTQVSQTQALQNKERILDWFRDTEISSRPIPFDATELMIAMVAPRKGSTMSVLLDAYSHSNEWVVISHHAAFLTVVSIVDHAKIKGKLLSVKEELSYDVAHQAYHQLRQRQRNYAFYASEIDPVEYMMNVRAFQDNVEDLMIKTSALIGEVYQSLETRQLLKVKEQLDALRSQLAIQALNKNEVIQIMQSFVHYQTGNHIDLSNCRTLDDLMYQTADLLRVNSYQLEFDQLHPSVQAAMHLVEAQYRKDINLTQLAEQLHINVMYLGQLFKKELNASFSHYLNQFRIEKSKQLLLRTQLTIAEVGIEVGYQNQAYFYRVFKNLVGVSPKEFRQEHVKE